MTSATLVPEWLHQRALLSPAKVALACGDICWTFAELDARAAATASWLRAAGVKKGDRVALLARNSAEFVAVVWGLMRAGAVLVPLNTRLSGEEVVWQIGDCEARFLIVDEASKGLSGNLRAGSPALSVLDLPRLPFEPGAVLRQAQDGGEGTSFGRPEPVEGLRRRLQPEPAERTDLAGLHSVIYTSGTTGRPKGAMLSYGNHFWSAVGSALNLGLHEDDRWLACLPLFHIGGLSLLFKSVIYGVSVVIHEAFDPAEVNKSIDGDGITAVSLVATMLRRMFAVRGPEPYPTSLRFVLLGGGPAPGDLVAECQNRGVPVALTYGLTEACSQVTTLPMREVAARPASAGKPLFMTQVAILGDKGETCGPQEAGEIAVRGPTVTAGYLGRETETQRLLADGWLHTGDWGYLDGEGYLYVLDRRDDIIISGGENVYPAEVEAVLESHPSVAEAGVYGVADREWGAAVAAAVCLVPNQVVSEPDLREFCRQHLAAFKVPRRIRFEKELPRNAAGKLLRRELREGEQ